MKSSHIAMIVAAVVVIGAISAFVIYDNSEDDDRQTITVTMEWEKSIIESISGDEYNVVSFMSADESPHTATPSSSNIADLYDSVIYFEIGSGVEFETSMLTDDVVSEIPSTVEVVLLADYVDELIDTDGNSVSEVTSSTDPHIWTSPDNLADIAEIIMEKLSELNPDNASLYEENYEAYLDEIDAVNEKMETLADLIDSLDENDLTVIVWHPAWRYFLLQYADSYLSDGSISMYAIEGNGEATMSDAITMISEQDNNVLYVSPTDEGYEYMDALEDEGIVVEVVDPTGSDALEQISLFIDLLYEQYSSTS